MPANPKLKEALNDSAAFICIARTMMYDMPEAWQEQMAKLLSEYSSAYPNWPEDWKMRIKLYAGRKMIPMPDVFIEYNKDWRAELAKFK